MTFIAITPLYQMIENTQETEPMLTSRQLFLVQASGRRSTLNHAETQMRSAGEGKHGGLALKVDLVRIPQTQLPFQSRSGPGSAAPS